MCFLSASPFGRHEVGGITAWDSVVSPVLGFTEAANTVPDADWLALVDLSFSDANAVAATRQPR